MATRIIKLACVNDSHVREFPDTGVDKNGDPTSNRQALMHVLEKRVTLGDGAVVPAFRLAEAPSVVFANDEEFDNRTLRNDEGKWSLPTPGWLAIRAKRTEARREREDIHSNHATQAQAQNVTAAMVDLARSITNTGAIPRSQPASMKVGGK